jgi:hypothetical protein
VTANQNNYTPTGIEEATIVFISSTVTTAPYASITGLVGGTPGRRLTVLNIGANTVVLKQEDTDSAAANRFNFGRVAGSMRIDGGGALTLQWDADISRWRPEASFGIALNGGLRDSGDPLAPYVFNIQKELYLMGVLGPTALGANQNNYAPTGIDTSSVLRLTTSAGADRNITGLSCTPARSS